MCLDLTGGGNCFVPGSIALLRFRWPIRYAVIAGKSRRLITRSINPAFSSVFEWCESFGGAMPVVCSITRGPTNPICAFGSAIRMSPSDAKLAVTPPNVGSVKMEIKASSCRSCTEAAAATLAICIRENMPSCTRAPPLAATLTSGILRCVASSNACAIFSPTTEPIVPPKNAKSKTTSTACWPPMRQKPEVTASRTPVSRRASCNRVRYVLWSAKPSGSTETRSRSSSRNVPSSASNAIRALDGIVR